MRLALDDGRGHVQTDWREVDATGTASVRTTARSASTANAARSRAATGCAARFCRPAIVSSAAFRVGGGLAGNVAARTLTDVPLTPENLERAPALAALVTPLVVRQPFAATGGSAQETLAAAQARAFDAFTRIDKAVTLEDVERLALATPGDSDRRACARLRASIRACPAIRRRGSSPWS